MPRADRALIAAALITATAAAEARFAPPEGRVIHQTLVEERQDARGTQRYTNRRDIVFARTATGYRATVTIGMGDTPQGSAAAMFAAGIAALRGQAIVFNLDSAGTLQSIDDEAALWTRFCDAIAGMAGQGAAPDSERARNLAALVAPLRNLPAERRRAILGSVLTVVIAGPLADRVPGTAAVTVPARGLGGAEQQLAGTETVRAAEGGVVIDTLASGDAPSAGRTAHLTITTHHRIDQAHGLIAEMRSIENIRIGDDNAQSAVKITSSSRIDY